MTTDFYTVYMQFDKNVKVTDQMFSLGEITKITCSEKSLEQKIKNIRVPAPQITGPGRYIFSAIDIIEIVQSAFPQILIQNLGETDFIITLEKKKQPGPVWEWAKTAFICLLAFFGAAFSIMSFNNDVGITNLFGQLYFLFTGESSDGFTVLEISYSVGLGLGIVLFFNHFAGKKLTADPTPLEVEMRTYEDEIDKTLIEAAGRNSK